MSSVGRMKPSVDSLPDGQGPLLRQLREEAIELKDCFTRFSFQATGFCILYIGVLARVQGQAHWLGVCSLPLLLILRIVTRVGVHKYGSANRNLGYELHLYRTLDAPEHREGWHDAYREIGWEQAMRAWRVIQATVFEYLGLHKPARSFAGALDAGVPLPAERWYEPKSLVEEGTTYYAGSFLRKVVKSLHFLMYLSLVPFVFSVGSATNSFFTTSNPSTLQFVLMMVGVVGLLMVIFYVNAVRQDDMRRVDMLEGGLLSIHSCAIMWQAVVVGHYRALESALTVNGGKSPRGYTRFLSEQALGVRSRIHDIYDWIDGSRSRNMPRIRKSLAAEVELEDGGRVVPGKLFDYSFDGSGVGFIPSEVLDLDGLPESGSSITLRIGELDTPGRLVLPVLPHIDPSDGMTADLPRVSRLGVRIGDVERRLKLRELLGGGAQVN